MANNKPGNEAYSPHADSVRQQLDAKIDNLKDKIDGKVSQTQFNWVIGILVIIFLAIVGYSVHLVNEANNTSNELSMRITAIETTITDLLIKK
mgnify:CR=1 FL=1